MTEIETKVSVRRNNGEIVSADVSMYNDVGDVVKKITIIDSDALASLEATITGFEEVYVDNEQLQTILANINENTNINSTTLGGLQSDEFAKTNHNHTGYAPTNHSSNSNEYGMGTTSQYGHVKTVNNLNTPSYISGESLSAYQGALLNNKVSSAQSQIELINANIEKNSMVLKVGKSSDRSGEDKYGLNVNRGSNIYVKIYCDKDISNFWNGKTVEFYINGVLYPRFFDNNGEAVLNIKLNEGTYFLNVFCGDIGGVNGTNVCKVIRVIA